MGKVIHFPVSSGKRIKNWTILRYSSMLICTVTPICSETFLKVNFYFKCPGNQCIVPLDFMHLPLDIAIYFQFRVFKWCPSLNLSKYCGFLAKIRSFWCKKH